MSEHNKTVMRRIYDEFWNAGNFENIDELLSPDYVGHLPSPPGAPEGRDGLVWLIQAYRSAFPDIHAEVQDQIAEGDKVMTRVTLRGTHQGKFMQFEATGNAIELDIYVMTRFENGLNVEGWAGMDRLVLMQQLGVIPS